MQAPSDQGSLDEDESFVFGEVAEVFGVQRGEGEVIDQAARGDPGVVVRPGPPAALRAGLKLAPRVRYRLVVLEHGDVLAPPGQVGDAARPPAPQGAPLHQLPDRDEGNGHRVPGQPRPQSVGQAPPQRERGYVGVQDDQAHGRLARREAYRSARNSSSSSSDSHTPGKASSSTEPIGWTPCRRTCSSAGTCGAGGGAGAYSALLDMAISLQSVPG